MYVAVKLMYGLIVNVFYFISLIKMLYWMVSNKTDSVLTKKDLIHAIRRNFDGLDKFDATKIFLSHIDSKSLDKQTATSEPSKESKVQFSHEFSSTYSYVATYVHIMLNKNTLGVKKVRGQSEATMVI